ncbi:type II toxin-antitoxin system YafQ family toxin [Cyanobium sp. ATX 6F1]|uniref:type II toxin-antitoxin system RelE/ParE family toxin n=1 Tax=unclassified Cyanobium TaxID=2627006 RepID=UPI0020CBC972|nr:type II toxin-antitoxin system YafQ family toxin [Cyanobium sp. ATX 6F1]MCP9914864.1 type II toxin-antitoxin system YafQ family toxin [Cyanobium sp. ATX 6F1]
MNWTLVVTGHFSKKAKKFLKQHPEQSKLYLKILLLLEANPYHPSLRLHPLQGKHKGLHSVSMNMSYRITLEFLIEGNQLILIDIGDHDAIYRG